MKKVLITLLFNLALFYGYGQDCPSCDNYLDFMYDVVSIQKDENFQQSFKTWFLSERFEKEIKNNKKNISITIPFKGTILTFGGSNESSNVWETWQRNQNSTEWDFTKISKDVIFTQIATTESRNVWLQCIEFTCGAQTQLFPVKAYSNSSEAIYTFSYNRNIFETTPLYENFTCFGGLDCSEANKNYVGKQMKANGEAIKFLWMNTDDNEGGVIVNTTKGTTLIKKVFKNIKAKEGLLEYISETLGDLNNPSEIVKVGQVNEEKIAYGMNDIKAIDCFTGHLSPDGKRCANLSKFVYKSSPEQINKNLQYQCLDDRGFLCGWSHVDGFQADGKEVWLQIRNWGPSSLWRVSFDIYKAKTMLKREVFPIQITNNIFYFNIPENSNFPILTIKLENNKSITFRPEESVEGIELIQKQKEASSTNYGFRIK